MRALKPAALWLHRQLGLYLTAVMLLLGLSGSLLLFRAELETPPASVSVAHLQAQPAYQAALDSALRHAHSANLSLRFGEAGEPVEASARDHGHEWVLWLDLADGTLLREQVADSGRGLFPWLAELHHKLFTSDTGTNVVGWLGVGLLLTVLSGLLLWWPKQFKKALRLHPDTGSLAWYRQPAPACRCRFRTAARCACCWR
ncbi:PepSY domain-containing protein [Neisseriaceae bacterium JH1-16]|nr:PepSY domain-containing protein [Neisseriaceae bacterium JH1-16]